MSSLAPPWRTFGSRMLEEDHSMVNIIIFPVIFTDKQDIPSSKTKIVLAGTINFILETKNRIQ